MSAKVWMITGAGRGFGAEWTRAALERGDRVVATARNLSALEELIREFGDAFLPLALDVRDRAGCALAVERAVSRFGRIDVLINNAGYGHFGMAEELTEDELRDQMETNFFGAVWVTQAVLPTMRAQQSGHIIQVSSIGGITAFINLSAYHASKWALEGFTQSLAQEVADHGIAVTLIEPGPFSTDWAGSSARRSTHLPAYDGARAAREAQRSNRAIGDPSASRAALLRVVDADKPPLRVFFGSGPLPIAMAEYERRVNVWRDWNDVSVLAQGTVEP